MEYTDTDVFWHTIFVVVNGIEEVLLVGTGSRTD